MQFTVLSHAGLLIEHRGVRLVCDPWLIGSCYWRSWWNFPEPPAELIQKLDAQYVYLTHLHWDHFHGPSLQKLFDPQTIIIVPKVPTRRMVSDLQWLGFKNIIEVPHGKQVQLGEDFTLRSYQFGVGVDSGAIVSGGGHHLFNCNDTKFFGLPLHQIMSDFPKIDFIFRSHSSASPVPHCVDDHRSLLQIDSPDYDSADQFVRCALYVGARYAIPFASNHCFLHKETRHFNATATTPEDVRTRYAAVAAETNQRSECVVMPPGSSWSDTGGFNVVPFDFSAREQYIETLQAKHADKLEQTYREEALAVAQFEPFQKYFQDLLRSLPAMVRKRMPGIVFRIQDAQGEHLWLVDPGASQVQSVASAPLDHAIIQVPARVLNDCVQHRMFSVWGPSKRMKIVLPAAKDLSAVNSWFTLLDLYELEVFPLRNNFSLRSLSVRLRRWREPVEVVRILLRRLVLRQAFSVGNIYRGKSPAA
jgi:UDP-MurNAc hydroxylase